MYKLVVLLASVGIAVAKPSHIHGVAPVTYSESVVEESTAVRHQFRSDIISKPAVATYTQEILAAPVVQKSIPVAALTLPQVAPVLSYVTAPMTGTAISKNVHYAQSDVVTGYTSQVIKPNLESLATSLEAVSKSHILASEGPVGTVIPIVKQAEPEVTVSKVEVPVPVQPALSQIEVRTAEAAQPAITYSSPALATSYALNVAPASGYTFAAPVATDYTVNVAPLVSGYGLSAHLGQLAYSSPSVATRYAVPAVTTYTATPAVLSAKSTVATSEVRQESPLYTEAKLQAW